jgi:hypothetical protein
MASARKPVEVEVGTALPSGIQFISQHQVKDENAAFAIDLPGTVFRSDETTVQTILPRARIVVPKMRPVRAARISAAVTDNLTLRRAGTDLLAQIDSQAPISFALRFTVAHSMGEVLEAAANARGDTSGCGCNGGEAALPGAVAIGLALRAGGNLKWSEPISATIYARSDGALDFGGTDKAHCVAVRDNCTETWDFWDNSTTCTGLQCTSPEVCKCGDDKQGNPLTKCSGWVRCNCNV